MSHLMHMLWRRIGWPTAACTSFGPCLKAYGGDDKIPTQIILQLNASTVDAMSTFLKTRCLG